MAVLREAVAASRQVEIEYYAFGRDEWTTRTVDPSTVFSAAGQWYVSAWCHLVDDERLFRVDRIRTADPPRHRLLPAGRRPGSWPSTGPGPTTPGSTLELDPAAAWVVEQYPVEKVEPVDGDGGRVRVTLAASQRAWLERLLLRLGPAARVVDGDPELAGTAARRILDRYRDG